MQSCETLENTFSSKCDYLISIYLSEALIRIKNYNAAINILKNYLENRSTNVEFIDGMSHYLINKFHLSYLISSTIIFHS